MMNSCICVSLSKQVVANHCRWLPNNHFFVFFSSFQNNSVCIIFTDIVGFSAMSMHLSPIKIMDMLQNLYSRFDELCDVHGVLKLE
jgi:hypothetical protein